MNLSQKQLCSISFVNYLRVADASFVEEIGSEYNTDPSSSFAADSFMSQDPELSAMWEDCDKPYFFQLLLQEAARLKSAM
jgi:hypothetical protein